MPEQKDRSALPQPDHLVDHQRVIGISDAVFAFALTLLVLEIRVPGGLNKTDLINTLLGMGPRLLVYLISFLIIGLAWDGHQRIMSRILWSDGVLVWLNMATLLFVTLLPATSALLGQYPNEPLAVACLAANGCLLDLAEWLLWRHACVNHRLVSPDLPDGIIRMVGQIVLASAVVYGLSIFIAFVSIPLVGIACVAAQFASYLMPRWFLRMANARKAPVKSINGGR
jgi:uncharacterized membrane protein